MESKRCSTCKEFLDLCEFRKNKAQVSGLHNQCKGCEKLSYEKIRETRIAYLREYYLANREHARADRRERHLLNRDSDNARVRRHYQENSAIYKQRARARQQDLIGLHTKEEISTLYLKQSGKCACCRKKLKSDYHCDHIYPVARGGTNDILNIQLLCPLCNRRKHAKDPINFMQEEGYLI